MYFNYKTQFFTEKLNTLFYKITLYMEKQIYLNKITFIFSIKYNTQII